MKVLWIWTMIWNDDLFFNYTSTKVQLMNRYVVRRYAWKNCRTSLDICIEVFMTLKQLSWIQLHPCVAHVRTLLFFCIVTCYFCLIISIFIAIILYMDVIFVISQLQIRYSHYYCSWHILEPNTISNPNWIDLCGRLSRIAPKTTQNELRFNTTSRSYPLTKASSWNNVGLLDFVITPNLLL